MANWWSSKVHAKYVWVCDVFIFFIWIARRDILYAYVRVCECNVCIRLSRLHHSDPIYETREYFWLDTMMIDGIECVMCIVPQSICTAHVFIRILLWWPYWYLNWCVHNRTHCSFILEQNQNENLRQNLYTIRSCMTHCNWTKMDEHSNSSGSLLYIYWPR